MPHDTSWASSSPPASITPPSPNSQLDSSTSSDNIHKAGTCSCVSEDNSPQGLLRRRQSQQSTLAKAAMAAEQRRWSGNSALSEKEVEQLRNQLDKTLSNQNSSTSDSLPENKRLPTPARGASMAAALQGTVTDANGASRALNDTPATTAPNSPYISGNRSSGGSDGAPSINLGAALRQTSGASTPRVRPTTLNIPGLTKSKVSPDGKIAQRDVGSKLVIVMVGLPARGKSYITKKLARYLNWLQHDTKIFNVGERRRIVAGGPNSLEKTKSPRVVHHRQGSSIDKLRPLDPHANAIENSAPAVPRRSAAQIILNGNTQLEVPATPPHNAMATTEFDLDKTTALSSEGESLATKVPSANEPEQVSEQDEDAIEQNAAFFDPSNIKASQIREQVARETLDELLEYILNGPGSVGILDATNSTLERRKMIIDYIRARVGDDLNVLFLESSCVDQELLEANMRLKLNGPDYRDMDPTVALEDFKKRVNEYEKAYVPLGEYEEKNNIPYLQIIDVGRKIISHQIRGFLMAQTNYYLLNFNLAPRQIWITRHGLSMDNVSGKLGGDSSLAPEGQEFALSLTRFMDVKRQEWDLKQIENLKKTHFPPQPGDATPPNPYYHPVSPTSESSDAFSALEDAEEVGYERKAFCVWTSMLNRSIETAKNFNDEDYEIKQMRMLDELNAGVMEGLTYQCIQSQHPDEYERRKRDKLHYRYPGPGGEGYLDIINRMRPVIVELERMTDNVLLVGHRSVARVLLAYFRGLDREEVADLDVPIGMLYCLEPKPYGVDFKAYKWDRQQKWFDHVPDFKLKRAENDMME